MKSVIENRLLAYRCICKYLKSVFGIVLGTMRFKARVGALQVLADEGEGAVLSFHL